MTEPNEPPRAPIGKSGAEHAAPTVGYLIGGLVQLTLGALIILANLVETSRVSSIFGLFLVFLGIRTVVKYKARSKRPRTAA